MQTIDTEVLKTKADLLEIAGRYTALRRNSATDQCGPCPHPACSAGRDGFHVFTNRHGEQRFRCYTCHPKPGDTIEFLQWIGEAGSFREACNLIDAGSFPEPKRRRKPERKKPAPGWKSDTWQREADALLRDAQDRLWNLPDGEAGRAYLAGRGIRPDMPIAFGLGVADVWHPVRKEERPAILIPWRGNRYTTAVQCRFIDPDLDHGERFSMKGGGERILFGLNLFHHTEADLLILCEGELNAVSLFQVCYGTHPAHVASWGPQDNISNPDVAEVASRIAGKYARVVVWADEPDRAVAAMGALGCAGVIALKSPRGKDANDLLQEGLLPAFVRRLMEKHGVPA